MQKNKPKVKLIGEDGNALAILAKCARAWRDAGNEGWEIIEMQMTISDYDNLLSVVQTYFEVV